MTPRISTDHLNRGAVVYVRQSTMAQVLGNTESRRRIDGAGMSLLPLRTGFDKKPAPS